ncbi:MAG: hypothetical protein JWN40_4873 [Phycisphaerales bacterium]|nr:hypothetical protein [Phycisphaerales bacterium]
MIRMGNRFFRASIAIAVLAGGCDRKDGSAVKSTESATMKPKSHIPRSQLEQMFQGIRQKTKWNIDGDMLWGYFFFDPLPDRLNAARRELESQGYRFVDLFELEREEKKTGVYMLHVEKVEKHTINSLDQRNGELDAFAANHGLQGYDGMDVGPATPATQPATNRPPQKHD